MQGRLRSLPQRCLPELPLPLWCAFERERLRSLPQRWLLELPLLAERCAGCAFERERPRLLP